MRKIFLTFIVLTLAHIVFAQNKQTIVVRPETYREKQEREMRNVIEFFNDLGSIFGSTPEQRKAYLTEVKNSRYSTFVEKEMAEWKKKGEFEKTADWQKRLQDSTVIKKVEIQEYGIDKFARQLNVVDYYLNNWLYDSNAEYDADEEVLKINTFWGKIPIPIPIDKARNMRMYVSDLTARFFIYNDQLALLSLSYNGYTYENQSPAATNILQKEWEEKKRQEEIEKEFKDKIFDYDSVEVKPSFPGRNEGLMKWLNDNINYPIVAAEYGIQGQVLVQFVVRYDGRIDGVKVLKGVHPSLDNEAIRLVKSMPRWVSGKQNGVPINVYCFLPVNFVLK